MCDFAVAAGGTTAPLLRGKGTNVRTISRISARWLRRMLVRSGSEVAVAMETTEKRKGKWREKERKWRKNGGRKEKKKWKKCTKKGKNAQK